MNKKYDPSAPGVQNGKIYGLPFKESEAAFVLIPVPWDVTTSYGAGTANGPLQILTASPQLDIYDLDEPNAWEKGIYMQEIDENWKRKSKNLGKHSTLVIDAWESGADPIQHASFQKDIQLINHECEQLMNQVYQRSTEQLNQGKFVGIVGGDHSTPLGLMRALSDVHSFGILQIDAHADLRTAYEGFTYSHASIMHNALKLNNIERLIQVGIRDICAEEIHEIKNSKDRIQTHFMRDIEIELFKGGKWDNMCEEMIATLPENVYVSFDIDGLEQFYCDKTGTPVPGGLQFEQAIHLVRKVVESGRKIIGFDLCEVGDDEWNGNVGARILYKLICLSSLSQKK